MSKMIVVFQNLLEHDINKEGILYLQYSSVSTFTNIFFIIGQDQSSLLNHCLSTQWRPHARPRAMRRALLSFTNNTAFFYKQSPLPIHSRLLLENNSLLLVNNSLLLVNNSLLLVNNRLLQLPPLLCWKKCPKNYYCYAKKSILWESPIVTEKQFRLIALSKSGILKTYKNQA